MIKRPDQRVAVFIDTQNMYHSAKHLFGSRVNFGGLVEAAVANRKLIRAVAYVAKSKTGEEQAFFDALIQSGIELKIKDVQEFASGAKKADWDVGMAVDAMAISQRVDAVILVTGDGDFVPLVQFFKSNGVLAEVVAFGESTNSQLREVADSFLDLSTEPERFLIHSRGPARTEAQRGRRVDAEEIAESSPTPEKKDKPSRDTRRRGTGGLRKIKITY